MVNAFKDWHIGSMLVCVAWVFATLFGVGTALYQPNYLFAVTQIVLSVLAFPKVKEHFKKL